MARYYTAMVPCAAPTCTVLRKVITSSTELVTLEDLPRGWARAEDLYEERVRHRFVCRDCAAARRRRDEEDAWGQRQNASRMARLRKGLSK